MSFDHDQTESHAKLLVRPKKPAAQCQDNKFWACTLKDKEIWSLVGRRSLAKEKRIVGNKEEEGEDVKENRMSIKKFTVNDYMVAFLISTQV